MQDEQRILWDVVGPETLLALAHAGLAGMRVTIPDVRAVDRERRRLQVAELTDRGFSATQIARKLQISVSYVKRLRGESVRSPRKGGYPEE